MDGWTVGEGDWPVPQRVLTPEEVDAALSCITEETVNRAQAQLEAES